MIVGEALNRRADVQKRVAQLESRVAACALAQEGEEPPENPDELLAELDGLCDELEDLIARINQTNATARLASGETVTAGLARRDVIGMRQGALRAAINAATGRGLGLGVSRYSRSEIRMVRQVRVGELQSRLDGLAKERRELDNSLQQHNWQANLIE
ncbi:MAG: DIP1984 family protein [Solirubrobacterales bacterium]|nr:DIP1984 family protein [Solirubrobacterales bacterium]